VIEEWERRQAQRAALAAQVRNNGGVGELTDGYGCAVLAARDPSLPGRWRFTRFDAEGPSGHMEAATLEEAVSYAYAEGYRTWEPGAISRLGSPR